MGVVAMLLLAAGCSGNAGDKVAVIGDSITSLDQADIQSQLGDEFDFTISGNFGKTVAEVEPEAELVATRPQDQVIINLGTNDVLEGVSVADSMASMRRMIALFASARCVHLVDINEHMVNQEDDVPASDGAKRFNAALVDLANSDERISIIAWAAEAGGRLNRQQPPYSTLTRDSVHPTQAGNRLLNELYERALEECDRARP